jgi:F-type H+-transporting ATPase subunit delta
VARASGAARRYARALFAIAREEWHVDEVGRELDALKTVLDESPELHAAVFQPLHPVAQRRAVLAGVLARLGATHSVRNFCSFLIEQRRLVAFPNIVAEFNRLADEAAGKLSAVVTSARPLGDAERERLRAALAARAGRNPGDVQLELRVDEDLVGGLVAQVGDVVFDGSIRNHLRQLRSNLTRSS